jgi:hypothetical protein
VPHGPLSSGASRAVNIGDKHNFVNRFNAFYTQASSGPLYLNRLLFTPSIAAIVRITSSTPRARVASHIRPSSEVNAFAAMLINADHAPLEDTVIAFDRVRMNTLAGLAVRVGVFLAAMIDGFVRRDALGKIAVDVARNLLWVG